MSTFFIEKKYFFVALAIAVLVSVLVGVYFFYSKVSTQQKSERFLSSYNEALALSRIYGKEDEAIEKFKVALSLAPNAEASANITLLTAMNLYARNRGNDRIEAIGLLKDIIKNHNLSVQRRAAALDGIAIVVSDNGIDKELAKRYLFNNEPYSGYLSDAKGDFWGATRRIFEEADKMYPAVLSKINIAFMLAADLYKGKTEPEFSQKDTASLIQKYISDSAAISNDPNFSYTSTDQASMLVKKAVALGVSDRVLHNITKNDLELAYKQAISATDSDANNLYGQATGMYARFNYAIHLVSRFGNSRKSDILPLLAKIISIDSPYYRSFHYYLGVIANYPKDSLLKISTLKLATFSPDFRAFLARYGWSF